MILPRTAAVLGFVEVAALAIWLGGMILFAGVVAPALFRGLGRVEGARVMRMLFPPYYRWGSVCGAVLVIASALRAAVTDRPSAVQGSVLIVASLMLALTIYAWRVLLPRVDQARRRAEAADPTEGAYDRAHFHRIHAQSTRIHVAIMALGALGLWVAWLSG